MYSSSSRVYVLQNHCLCSALLTRECLLRLVAKSKSLTLETSYHAREKAMKKALVTMLAVAFIVTVTGSAMAKGVKPPKSLCLRSVQTGGPVLALGIKKGNKFIGPSGKFEMYTVQGIAVPMALSGAGYIQLDFFIFNLSSSFGDINYDMSGVWDIINETGILYVNETTLNNDFTSTQYDIISVPCDTL